MVINEKMHNVLEWVLCILIAFVLAIIIKFYIGIPTVVSQVSMVPTLKSGQRLLLNRWMRTIKEVPQRGDIITFEAPKIKGYSSLTEVDMQNPVAKYGEEQKNWVSNFVYYVLEIGKESYIKRVIALPGEHVEIKDGAVYINGEKLEENYLASSVTTETTGHNYFSDFVVPEGYIFAMGDNRRQSTDCRSFGCIPIEKVESKVWIRFWPLNLFGKID